MNAVVLLGPPGAGKGTVAKVLVDKGYRHVSTGELLREQIRLETPLGLEAKKLMDQGEFVPDAVVVGMIRELLQSSGKEAKFLFDGFPRTLVQAEKLDEIIQSLEGNLDDVILLECPSENIIQRLSGRRTCVTCGAVYHMVYNPSSSGEQCELDQGQLIQRPDDKVETIIKRLTVYAEQTAPLISYYRTKDQIHSIDATMSIEEVRSAVLKRLA